MVAEQDGIERAVVFRGSDPALLDLVEGMLEAEGMTPRRLGRTNAALMGGGNSAFMQLISVPTEHAAAARALIEAGAADDQETFEVVAMSAPAVDDDAARARRASPFDQIQLFYLMVGLGIVVAVGILW